MKGYFGSGRRASNSIFSILSVAAGVALVSLASCQTRRYNSATRSADAGPKVYKACLGIQGNGVLFSSHLGTLTALFENSIDPAVIIGGSSGSIVGSIGRALMTNPSIRDTQVVYKTTSGDTIELSYPQKAALVLAAAEDVMNGFLFLPGLDDVNKVLDGKTIGSNQQSIINFIFNFKKNLTEGGQLPSEAMTKILNIEATVGSAVLLTAFFQLYDFSPLLRDSNQRLSSQSPDYLADYKERKLWMKVNYERYVAADTWSLAEVVGLLSDPTVVLKPWGITPEFVKEIRRTKKEKFGKVKRLFSEDPVFVKENSFLEDQKLAENMMGNAVAGVIWWFLHAGGKATAESLNAAGEILKGVDPENPVYGTKINRILNGKFTVPDPDLVLEAYQGLVPDPKNRNQKIFVPVPEGMIIHSTFRRGHVEARKGYKREFWADFNDRRPQDSVKETAKEYILGQLKEFDIYSFADVPGFNNMYQGYIVGSAMGRGSFNDPNSLLSQMLSRRNSAWAEWKNSGNTWVKPESELLRQGLGRAPFLLYKYDSLSAARSAIIGTPVANLGDEKQREILPNNKDLQPGQMESYIPPNQVLLFDQLQASENGDFRNRGLNFGIQASAGEPGAFRRYAIRWTPKDIELNSLNAAETALPRLDSDDAMSTKVPPGFEEAKLVPFGGWGENVPLSSVAHLKACEEADIFVSSAKDAPGNDFQSGALRAVVQGAYQDGRGDGEKGRFKDPSKDKEIAGHFQRLTAAAMYSRHLPGKVWLFNDMNFDKPCALDSIAKKNACNEKELKLINDAIVPLPWGESRLNLALVGYQTTISSIKGAAMGNQDVLLGLKNGLARFNAFGQNVQNDIITDLAHWKNQKKVLWVIEQREVPARIKAYMDAVRLGEPVQSLK